MNCDDFIFLPFIHLNVKSGVLPGRVKQQSQASGTSLRII